MRRQTRCARPRVRPATARLPRALAQDPVRDADAEDPQAAHRQPLPRFAHRALGGAWTAPSSATPPRCTGSVSRPARSDVHWSAWGRKPLQGPCEQDLWGARRRGRRAALPLPVGRRHLRRGRDPEGRQPLRPSVPRATPAGRGSCRGSAGAGSTACSA